MSAFRIVTETSEFAAPALVVATGGLSIPKMGATPLGYEIAAHFGIAVKDCRPALVPLLLDQAAQHEWCDLAGLSAEVIASVGRQRFREKLLITHRGLSGPAILQISSYWREMEAIVDNGYVIIGSPDEVAEQLREVAVNLNVGHLMLLLQYGNMSKDLTRYNTKLFAEQVMPKLKDLHSGWDDRWWPKPMDASLRAAVPAFQPRLAAE